MSRPPDPTAPRPPSPLGFDPFAPLRPLVEGVGGVDQADRVRRGMLVHQAVPRPPVGLTPHTVIHAQNKLVVRYYPPTGAVRKTPVVVGNCTGFAVNRVFFPYTQVGGSAGCVWLGAQLG